MDFTTLDLINSIFLETKKYHEIFEIAEKDIIEEQQRKIEEFLNKDNKKNINNEKIVFDPSKSKDIDFNLVLDAFIKVNDSKFLETLDLATLNQLLILINKWISSEKTTTEKFNFLINNLFKDKNEENQDSVFQDSIIEKTRKQQDKTRLSDLLNESETENLSSIIENINFTFRNPLNYDLEQTLFSNLPIYNTSIINNEFQNHLNEFNPYQNLLHQGSVSEEFVSNYNKKINTDYSVERLYKEKKNR